MKRVLFLAFMLFSLNLSAQTAVKGKVIDSESGAGEVAAIVQFFESVGESPFAYTMTDSLGVFNIKIGKTGSILVKVENMGRKAVERQFEAAGQLVDLGEIPMEDDVQAIESSTVTALRNLVKIDVDKTTYDVEGDVSSKASTVLDMLRKVPMVTVDAQDNITVNGSSSFKVYVDGKPNQMMSSNASKIFKSMPASFVKNIEVITNPGAKYDAEGTGGVLNLVTRGSGAKAAADGMYGSVTASVDTKGSASTGLFLNVQKGKWSFGGNVNGGYNRNVVDYLTDQTSDGVQLVTEMDDMKSIAPMLYGEINASYEMDTLNLFSASFGLSSFGNNNETTGHLESLQNGSFMYGYDIDYEERSRFGGVNGSFDYQHSFADDKDKMLTISYRYSGSPMKTLGSNIYYNFQNISGIGEGRKQDANDNSTEHTFQADYTTPLHPGHTLSTGLKYIYRHNRADDDLYLYDGADWTLNDAGSSEYDYYNHIGAAYAEYAGTFGTLGLKAGLRYEHTWQNMNFHDGSSDDFSVNYGNLVPNFSLQWNLSQMQNIGLTYNMRISRPGITYLNPFVDRGTTMLSYGNPDIKSEKRHRIMLNYNYFSPKWVVSAKMGSSFCNNGISQYNFYDGEILNSTYGNVVKNYALQGNLFVNYNLSNETRIYSSVDASYNHYESEALAQENAGWNGSFLMGAQHSFPKNFRIGGDLFAMTKSYNLQGYSGGISFASLSLSKSFMDDKLSLTLRFSTNLNKGDLKIINYSEGANFTNLTDIRTSIRAVAFEIAYNFGHKSFAVKKTNRSITNDDVINASSGSATSAVNSAVSR